MSLFMSSCSGIFTGSPPSTILTGPELLANAGHSNDLLSKAPRLHVKNCPAG